MILRYAELFAGSGGFRLGIQQSGLDAECVYANELNTHAAAVYRHIWRTNELIEGDVHEQSTGGIPDIDFLTAGFPCQPFSVAGQRLGLADARGTLFFEIARILADKRPRHFLLENVKGLLGHEEGKTFQAILGVLASIGYRVEWEVLNSTCWVPQNRERVFIVGHLRGECSRTVFPLREDDGLLGENGREVLPCLTSSDWKGPSKQQVGLIVPITYHQNKSKTVTQHVELEPLRAGASHSYQGVSVVQKTSGQTVTVKTDETGCLQAGGANVRDKVPNVLQRSPDGGFCAGDPDAVNSIGSGSGRFANAASPIVNFRRLTPLECERLQGWPDYHTALGLYRTSSLPKSQRNGHEYTLRLVSDTQRYRLTGNGVTADVVREVVKKMMLTGCLL